MSAILFALLMLPAAAIAVCSDDPRWCGPPLRDASGQIARSRAVLAAFQRIHPCPTTGATSGPCVGWSKDHIIPLAVGGCDAVVNLQWLPDEIKSSSGTAPKDRWERSAYCQAPR